MPLQKLLLKPGVNKENTRYTNEGGWYDCDKIRFRQGTPEKIGGWSQISGYTYVGTCRSLWSWASLSGIVYVGVGTYLKFYIEQGGAYNGITPIRSYVTLSGPFVAIAPQTFTVTIANPAVLTASSLATITNGMAFTFTTTGSLPTGLTTGVTYYAVSSSTNTCRLALTVGGTAITTTGTQSGTHTLTSTTLTVTSSTHGCATGDYVNFLGAVALSTQAFTRSTATDFVITTALATNTPVVLTVSSGGTLPTGLAENTQYYIKVVSGTTVNFTNTIGGAAISTSTAGTGTFALYVKSGLTAAVLNSSFAVTVINVNSFTITTSVAAGVYDTGNGGTTVNANYEIPVGYDSSQPLTGWGAGAWGSGSWDYGQSSVAPARLWYQNNFGQDLIFGYRGGPLYYWNANITPTGLAVSININSQTVSAVTIATEYITFSTAIATGTPVKFTSTTSLPSPLVSGTVYYIVNPVAATAQLALTVGGAAINLTTTGSGTITIYTPATFTTSSTLSNGTAIQIVSTGTVPTGMTIGTTYYINNFASNSFNISATYGGDLIVLTGTQSGSQSIYAHGIPVTSMYGASDVPAYVNNMMVSDASRFTIAFGCTPYGGGELDPMLIRWSDQESVTNWTPQVTNQAGFIRLSHGSQILAAVQTRQEIVVFTDTSLYSLQYLGAPYVWGSQLLGDNISLAGYNTAVIASGTIYWMGVDKFYKYDGRVQTLRCDLLRFIYGDINLDQQAQFFAGTSEGFNEIWWFYCSSGSTTIDSYVTYNYGEDVWAYGTMARTAWLDSGLITNPIAATYSYNLVYHEYGVDDNTTGTALPIEAYVTSSEFDIGDGHNFGFIWRLLPDLTFRGSSTTGTTPQVTFYMLPLQNSGSGYNDPVESGNQSVGGTSYANVTRIGTYEVDQFTGQVYTRVRGRQMSIKISSNQVGTQWQLGAPRIDIRPDGRRGG